MYNISQAASRTGLTVPVLRAWERRYGIVEPRRSPAGYRIYDEGAIARLTAMRRLVQAGWSPSAAAAAIKSGTAPTDVADPSSGSDAVAPADRPTASDLGSSFVDAAGNLDSDRLEVLLDDMFARGSFERVADEHLMPAAVALGDAWADGRIDVAAEHLASHAVLRRLGAAYQAAGHQVAESGAILVGLPPGSRHELGALAFAVAARRAGLPVIYLGSDLPVDDWVLTAERVAARAAVIGAVTRADREAARDVATALIANRPSILIAFGGDHPPADNVIQEVGGRPPLRLPTRLDLAVRALSLRLDELPRSRLTPASGG
jgi:DNA-binding transcriptional MerR regulator/methylmalonyl-CoA mutase cobalamin-binding subunit